MANKSQIHASFGPRQVGSLHLPKEEVVNYQDLVRVGYDLREDKVAAMDSYWGGMDSIQPTVTTGSVSTPVQFLQNWLPGNVVVATAARKIDSLVGVTVSGRWEDEEIVQGLLEQTGSSQVYGDYTNVPLSSWNNNFERRTVVRFEEGMQIGNLEEARAAAMRVNDGQEKRNAATLALEIRRNNVGFSGFNSGNNRTYGFLNDPGLPAYVPFVAGASTFTTWATKTFLEIQRDILTMIQGIRSSSQENVDPGSTPMTLAVATDAREYLSKTSDFGISVMAWLKDAYPNIRVESAPQLNAAASATNACYLYAESVAGTGTDGDKVFIQIVPTRFIVTGVEKKAKGYIEDYSNATAGVMCKRPWAVYRGSGC